MNRTKVHSSWHRCSDVTNAFVSGWISPLDESLHSDYLERGPLALITAETDPGQFNNPQEFLRRYWATESLSKYPFDIAGINRSERAFSSFFEAEELCRASNQRLVDFWSRPVDERIRASLARARSKLNWLLSGISRDEVMQRAGWGPGASTSLKRKDAAHQNKWVFAAHVTASALPWYLALSKYGRVPEHPVTIVEGNKVTTVPKNAKTDRVIAIEPDWNMFFQLGLGRSIRRRLQRVGLLHPTAQERNKLLAQVGSRTGAFSTLDLKGASDSISLALCELLLPSNVIQILAELRSKFGDVGGTTVEYEKISSMGNGSTFELETALFWAISSSVAGESVVYGDDIIVPTEHAVEVIELLEFCGFSCNPKKTFTTGPFRESCGGHYFNGLDVTPPYFRKKLNSMQPILVAANAINSRSKAHLMVSHDCQPSWDLLSQKIPRKFRGLEGAGDVCLHLPFDRCTPRWDPDSQRFTGKGIFKRRRLAEAPILGAYTSALWGIGGDDTFPGEEEVIYISDWYAYH